MKSDIKLVQRYKIKYGIPNEADITIEMIFRHWDLEKSLALQLLESTKGNRWDIFEGCYSALYQELDWLNRYIETSSKILPNQKYKQWMEVIGPPPQRIFEVGSGKGEMIYYLASLGYNARATEVTRERGEKYTPEHHNLTWAVNDGVHLDLFEPKEYYDTVISADVIEHLHPDDIVDHFSGARYILKPNGRYILATPHKFFGPSDISSLFGVSMPLGMHLKEYTIYELSIALSKSGFRRVVFPQRQFSSRYHKFFLSKISDELKWVILLERLISHLPRYLLKKVCQNRRIFPPRKIFLVAIK